MHDDGPDPPARESSQRGRISSWGALAGDGSATSVDVRLRREFKGLTVRDLLADESLVEQLPGRVQSALDHIRQGDFESAESALPGAFGRVFAGPGPKTRLRHRAALWIVISALAAAVATATMALL